METECDFEVKPQLDLFKVKQRYRHIWRKKKRKTDHDELESTQEEEFSDPEVREQMAYLLSLKAALQELA